MFIHIVDISDVALIKRLKAAGAWLQWMATGVMQKWIEKQPAAVVYRRFCKKRCNKKRVMAYGLIGNDHPTPRERRLKP